MTKKYSFFYHFNKPATQRSGVVTMSVHVNKTCHLVQGIVCEVPASSKISARQPRFVMRGKCSTFEVIDGIMYIK